MIVRHFIKVLSEHLEVRLFLFPIPKIKKEKAQLETVICPQIAARALFCAERGLLSNEGSQQSSCIQREQSLFTPDIHCRHKEEPKRERY